MQVTKDKYMKITSVSWPAVHLCWSYNSVTMTRLCFFFFLFSFSFLLLLLLLIIVTSIRKYSAIKWQNVQFNPDIWHETLVSELKFPSKYQQNPGKSAPSNRSHQRNLSTESKTLSTWFPHLPPRTRSKDKSRRTRRKRNKFPLPRQSRAGDSYFQVRDASIFTGGGDVLEGIRLSLTGLDFHLFQPLSLDNFIWSTF